MATVYLTLDQLDLIGSGIQYPTIINSSTGGFAVSVGEARINQSLANILSTPVGIRLGNPAYGSQLYSCIFNNFVDFNLLKYYVQDAITKWEKRVTVSSINASEDPIQKHAINISIVYNIIKTNISGIFTYPFFTTPFLYGYSTSVPSLS